MTALDTRPIEVEVDFNSDGSAYFSRGWYLDGAKEELTEEALDELTEAYPEQLEDAELDRNIMRAEDAFEGDR